MISKLKKITDKNVVNYVLMNELEVLNDNQIIELFAHLIKTGKVWELRKHYGRMATHLIETGIITEGGIIIVR